MNPMSPDVLWRDAQLAFRADPPRAAALCEQLLAQAPGFWGAHWMLSRLFQARGAFRAALAHARASARGLRADAGAHEILLVSSGLISTGEYATCAQLLESLDPRARMDPMQLTGAAEQAMMLDDPALALHWADAARDAGVRSAALSFLRGNALKFTGRIDAATSAFEDAIRIEPTHPGAHYALASLDLAEGRQTRIDRLERLVSGNADDTTMAAWCYALFREFDDADAPDRAWPHLERAMALRKSISRYDAAREDAIYDRIIAAAHSDAIAPQATDDDHIPLFIIGLPRSGTTVVERILGNHADVATCGESNALRMAYKWASDYWCEGFLDTQAAARLDKTDAATVGTRYLQATQPIAGGKRWRTDKHPGNVELAGVALAGLPQSRIVHVRKDPMDACFGCLRELFTGAFYEWSYAFADIANHHRNVARLMRHLADVAAERIVDVQYEALVANPEAATRALIAGCGLQSQAGIEDITANTQPVTTASSVQVRQPIHAGRVGRWKRYAQALRPLEAALAGNGR
ncbi:TPR domain containing protein [Lysobacter dokdonensis DS-58]|uniref:TPR domain containing protein n=1 Tax=Lysobacter dokdonensis DS-58 TaxID=1300345 RepID=A0A0A2WCL7_9GAMM|nr:sulfotransferase [Lysobacter dokdonensis]KGQ17811.1 TPR domain containing protein [Lysobacter dokdonensis DS-58]